MFSAWRTFEATMCGRNSEAVIPAGLAAVHEAAIRKHAQQAVAFYTGLDSDKHGPKVKHYALAYCVDRVGWIDQLLTRSGLAPPHPKLALTRTISNTYSPDVPAERVFEAVSRELAVIATAAARGNA